MHSANEAAAKLGFLAKQHSRQFLIYYFFFCCHILFSFRCFQWRQRLLLLIINFFKWLIGTCGCPYAASYSFLSLSPFALPCGKSSSAAQASSCCHFLLCALRFPCCTVGNFVAVPTPSPFFYSPNSIYYLKHLLLLFLK